MNSVMHDKQRGFQSTANYKDISAVDKLSKHKEAFQDREQRADKNVLLNTVCIA